MPIYEYQCQSCGHAFETMQRLSEAPLTVCPQCQGPLKKLISAPAFQFKGSGWYVTDYSKSGGGGAGKGSATGDDGAKPADTKADAAKPAESSTTKAEAPSAPAKPSSTSD